VLIIEDEGVISLALEQIARSLECDVLGPAYTTDEAVALAADRRPDLIISDIDLREGGSGIAAVAEIRGQDSIPVIFVTAHPEMLGSDEPPADAVVIAKPTDMETVRRAIAGALERLGAV
jgi:CheY-like chemotaxis protein